MKKQLPDGWQICKVEDIAILIRGISYKKEQARNSEELGYKPILRANNINGELNFDSLVYVPEELINKNQYICKNDIVFAMSSGSKHLVGKSAHAKRDFDGSYGAFCGLVRGIDGICKKYLYYAFQERRFRTLINEASKGSNINNLKREHILDFEVFLPPLNEQKRIVAKIEELFSELDNGIAALKTAREQLKVYRQAILKHAFEGKLTAKWREKNADKLETPEQLLFRIQQERNKDLQELAKGSDNEAKRYLSKIAKAKINHSEKKLTVGAQWVSLIEICTFIVDCHNKTAPYENQGIWLIRTPCIKDGKIFLNEEARFISEETYEYWAKRCPPKPGDIIFTREAPMGEVGIVPENTKICMGQRMMLLRPPSHLASKYMLYSMMEPSFQSRMGASAVGTGVKHLRVGDVETLCIPLFSQAEQSAIIDILDAKLSVIEQFEKEIEKSLNQSEILRQSILKKAFSGKLVPQDSSDEPANKLLARISATKSMVDGR